MSAVRCRECGRVVGLSSAFLAGICSECDDKPMSLTDALWVVALGVLAPLTFLAAVFGLLVVLP